MAGPPTDWVKTALELTGHFEDSSDPMAAVTGNFDGMGISVGVLQWNIGSNSLQPIIAALGRDNVVATMPEYGAELWRACTSDVKTGLAICKGWQPQGKLKADARAELKALARSTPFVEQQISRSADVANRAFADAQAFAADDPAYDQPTKPLFCWFFDVRTQNGNLKGLRYLDVKNFVALNGPDGSDDVICNWLATRPSQLAGAVDSHKNASLWRNHVPAERLSLFVLSYLRAQLSSSAWRADVMNRKATIALWSGWVHQEKHDLSALLA